MKIHDDDEFPGLAARVRILLLHRQASVTRALRFFLPAALMATVVLVWTGPARPLAAGVPQARVTRVAPIVLPGEADSNSPAFWDLVDGQHLLHVFTSSRVPVISTGTMLTDLAIDTEVQCTGDPEHGHWMESAVLQGANGTLYGYYHEEPDHTCGGAGKTAPRIGAARSTDRGRHWEDLGIILEGPPDSERCETPNDYFVGGVGDFSAILDERGVDVYFFYSAYAGEREQQGVAVARMPWADRDAPQGRLELWDAGVWRYVSVEPLTAQVADAGALYSATISWHDRSGRVDAFWGPSVHWNTYLEQYVMLLNRAVNSAWKQDGVYVAFSPVLDDPSRWTWPVKILDNQRWYPQVMGLEPGEGTDKRADQTARLFIQGRSDYLITFERGR